MVRDNGLNQFRFLLGLREIVKSLPVGFSSQRPPSQGMEDERILEVDLPRVLGDRGVFVNVEFPDYRRDEAVLEEVKVDPGCVVRRYVSLLAYLVQGDIGPESFFQPSDYLAKNELFAIPTRNISKKEANVLLVDRLRNATSRDVVVNDLRNASRDQKVLEEGLGLFRDELQIFELVGQGPTHDLSPNSMSPITLQYV